MYLYLVIQPSAEPPQVHSQIITSSNPFVFISTKAGHYHLVNLACSWWKQLTTLLFGQASHTKPLHIPCDTQLPVSNSSCSTEPALVCSCLHWVILKPSLLHGPCHDNPSRSSLCFPPMFSMIFMCTITKNHGIKENLAVRSTGNHSLSTSVRYFCGGRENYEKTSQDKTSGFYFALSTPACSFVPCLALNLWHTIAKQPFYGRNLI